MVSRARAVGVFDRPTERLSFADEHNAEASRQGKLLVCERRKTLEKRILNRYEKRMSCIVLEKGCIFFLPSKFAAESVTGLNGFLRAQSQSNSIAKVDSITPITKIELDGNYVTCFLVLRLFYA